MPWRDGSGNSGNALSLSAHIILIRQCPATPPSLFLPCHSSCWCCLLLLLVVVVVVAAACHLMEFAAYALRMPGIILSTAAFRFLWNLRLCFESPLPLLPHSLLLVYFLFLFSFCLWPSLKSWHAACLTKSFFRLPFVLCSFDLAPHTHATLTGRLMYVSWLTRFYWPSCLLVFCTLSNFDGLGRVSFPSAFFRGNLIYACKSSWQAALRSLGKLKSSARVFVRMLIVCLASRLSREQLYSETYSQLPISLCLPCKAEEHVFQLARPVFVYFLVYLSTAWQFYRFTCMHEFQYAFFRILFRLGQQRRKSDNKHKGANNVDGSG